MKDDDPLGYKTPWYAKAAIVLAIVTLIIVAVALVGCTPQQQAARPVTTTSVVPDSVTIAGVDAHDGTVYKVDDTYYMVGTAYDCGFTWQNFNTPWCGYHFYSAPALTGPWTHIREAFTQVVNSPFHNQTWQSLCRGYGCFNPRMLQRPDGQWVLWFNAPGDLAKWNANGYYSMTCVGPAGPCGDGTGLTWTVKPALWICNAAEDFAVYADGANAYIMCVYRDRTLRIEKLDAAWLNGINQGTTSMLGGAQFLEGLGVFHDTDAWIVTFGDNCAYCVGTDTSYAVAQTPVGPWTMAPQKRREISGHSCGGQSRSISIIDGVVYQYLDTWDGSNSETNADIKLVPLSRTGAPLLSTPDGSPWVGPFAPFACG